MKYWSGKKPEVIILDGSENYLDMVKYELMDNIKYYHLPVSLLERYKKSISLVQTEYIVMCPDDEFMIESALNTCVSWLDLNPDYSSCGGQCLGFKYVNKSLLGLNPYPKTKGYCIENDNTKDRVLEYLSNYIPVYYNVMRTSLYIKFVKLWSRREFNVCSIVEIQHAIMLLCHGKVISLPVLLWLRSFENEPIRNTDPALNANNTIPIWWLNEKTKKEREEFIDIMSCEFIESNSNDEIEEVKDAIRTGMSLYVKDRLSMHKRNKILDITKGMIKKYIPEFLYKKIIKIAENKNLIDYAGKMKNEGVYIDFKELSNIEETVIRFQE